MRLVAELLAPRPQPARRMVQRMLVGKAHRAMHLMGDRRAGAGGLADPHLGDRHLGGGEFAPPVQAIASAAASAAAPAAATSPASVARLCCTAWNLAIGRPNCDPVERPLHRLIEDLFERARHLLRPRRGAELHEPIVSRSGAGRTATGVAPSNETVSRGSPARLVPWLIASPAAGTSATRRSALIGEDGDVAGVAGERHLPGAAAQRALGAELDMAVLIAPARSSSAPPAPRCRPAPAASPRAASRRAAPAPQTARRRATRQTVDHLGPGAAESVGDPGQGQPDSLERVPQRLRPLPFLGGIDRARARTDRRKIRVAVSTMMLSLLSLIPVLLAAVAAIVKQTSRNGKPPWACGSSLPRDLLGLTRGTPRRERGCLSRARRRVKLVAWFG